MDSKRDTEPNTTRADVVHRLTHPVALIGIALLAWEFLIALVVIFSRMSAGFQFLCVLLMAIPMLAIVAVALRAALPARSNHPALRQPEPIHEPRLRETTEGEHEALDLVTHLEELADNTRRFPLNISTGFDDEQFTYTTLKLRATIQDLITREPDGVGHGRRTVPQVSDAITEPFSGQPPALQPAPTLLKHVEPPQPQLLDAIAEPPPLETAFEDVPQPTPDAPRQPIAEAIVETPAGHVADDQVADQIEEVNESHPDELETPEEVETPSEPDDNKTRLPDTIAAAREALRSRDSEEAIRLLSCINGAAEASELLGIAYEIAGNRNAALDALKVAIQTDSDRASAHFNYAVILAKDQRLDEAAREAKVALDLNPDYASAKELVKSLERPREIQIR